MMVALSDTPLLLTFNLFAKQNDVLVFVTSRLGGYSTENYNALNMGFNDFESSNTTIANRELVCHTLNVSPETFTFQQQTHSDHITIITKENAGAGFYSKKESIQDNDALITNQKGITLFAQAADCVPIALYDPNKKVAAAVHAGWRGTINRIAAKTALKMSSEFGCNMNDIMVGIGPSIGQCCYEVGDDVISEVTNKFSYNKELISNCYSKPHLDLWIANKLQLVEVGINTDKIETAQICTKCQCDKFYSSRASNGITGRFGIGICIK